MLRKTVLSTLTLLVLATTTAAVSTTTASAGGYGNSGYQHQNQYQYPQQHVRWCHARFKTYNAYNNTYQPYHGRRTQCWSPYYRG